MNSLPYFRWAALLLGLLGLASASCAKVVPTTGLHTLDVPPPGKIYQGFFYGGEERAGTTGENSYEAAPSPQQIAQFQEPSQIGKGVAWVYFSNDWFDSRLFPTKPAQWIQAAGKVPYIRLMTRSSADESHVETAYTLDNILAGQWDADFRAWGQAARAFGGPLLLEWGTEMNGCWFPWNGCNNGGEFGNLYGDPRVPDGPERFVAAYRRIVDLIRGQGAYNVTWVWHANVNDDPGESWNRMENYYPGDAYADWIGVSVYGPQSPGERGRIESFRQDMDPFMARIRKLAPGKPVALAEFGADIHADYTNALGFRNLNAGDWATAVLKDLMTLRWPEVIGFAWWNSSWTNEDDSRTNMVIWEDPNLLNAFHTYFKAYPDRLQESPVLKSVTLPPAPPRHRFLVNGLPSPQ